MPDRISTRLLATVTLLLVLMVCTAQERLSPPPKRAAPPKFDPKKVSEYFFDDVFSKLVGERPALGSVSGGATAPGALAPGVHAPGVTAQPAPGGSLSLGAARGTGWSTLISPTTIEDEIKAIKQAVDKNVTTPTDFVSRGYKVIRREFSVLAMLFAIVAEYDGDVRFKRDAREASSLFARTANNAKAGGNSNVFNEAKLRKTDLEDLLSGSSLSAEASEGSNGWPTIIDRSPLMQRLEICFQSQLTPALASSAEFTKQSQAILHQAELIAAMAEVLLKPGMDDADDGTYSGFARSMRDAAREVADGVRLKNYDQARAAAGKVDQACSQCHEAYR